MCVSITILQLTADINWQLLQKKNVKNKKRTYAIIIIACLHRLHFFL